MTYTALEIKFLRHALDTNSQGEAGNAAAMFFRELRKRGIKAHQFESNDGSAAAAPPRSKEFDNQDYKVLYENLLEERKLGNMYYNIELNGRRRAEENSEKERIARVQAEQALAQCQKALANVQAKQAKEARKRKPYFIWEY